MGAGKRTDIPLSLFLLQSSPISHILNLPQLLLLSCHLSFLSSFSSPAPAPPHLAPPGPASASCQSQKPNGFEQGSQSPPHLPPPKPPQATRPPPQSERDSIGLEANQSQRVSSRDWIWPGLTGVRWVGGGWGGLILAPLQ